MSVIGRAGTLMGSYLADTDAAVRDDRSLMRMFVDEQGARAGLAAAREIEDWLAVAGHDDEALWQLYERKRGTFRPDPRTHTLAEYLRDTADYVGTYSRDVVAAAVDEMGWLPPRTVEAIVGRLGARGLSWLRQLPDLSADVHRAWALQRGPILPSTSGFVARATTSDGRPVMLEIGPWPSQWPPSEISALLAFAGECTVSLYDVDLDRSAVLLEAATPGRPLSELAARDDERATEIAATLLRGLWRPAEELLDPTGRFDLRPPTPVSWAGLGLTRYLESFGHSGPIDGSLIRAAREVLTQLLATARESPTLLHGDFHHGHVLSNNASPLGWVAIRPKGWSGDPGYDIASLLYRPRAQLVAASDLTALVDRRVRQLSELLDSDQARLKAWALVRAVGAEVAAVEETGAPHGLPLAVAAHLLSAM